MQSPQHMFSLFLVQSKNSECLEGLDHGQTHPCFLKCLFAKSSRLDNCNDIEAETLCFEHFLALRLLHLWPLSELRAAAFLSSCKNSQLEHLYNLYPVPAADSFQCAAKTMHVVQVVQTEFFSCVWCTFFLPFHLFICSRKVQKQSSCKYWKVQQHF